MNSLHLIIGCVWQYICWCCNLCVVILCKNTLFYEYNVEYFCIFAESRAMNNKFNTMTEVKSKKPLLEAIQNGEQIIKVTAPKFLLACLVAEECDNDKSNVKKFLNVILRSREGFYTQDRPSLRVSLVNEKGKIWWMFINLSICSMALGIIDILNDTYAKIKVEKDDRGNLTGNVEILV